MVEPYPVVALSPRTFTIKKRDDAQTDGGIIDLLGGHSGVVDSGTIAGQQTSWASGDSFVTTVVEALRRIRLADALYDQVKDLRAEQYAAIYANQICPNNLYLKEPLKKGAHA